jgi:hypothetical protein
VGRYRVTVPLTLDFGTGGDVRVDCWIRGTERFSGLSSDWTAPRSASARNPVPPLPPGPPDPLTWASLADATGRSRAHLTWTPTAGAVAYTVYAADETALLAGAGYGPPDLDQPLDARKVALDSVTRIERLRDAFTRVSADPIAGTSYDVELPRGSAILHGFVVLARSAAGVESPWPTKPPVEVGGRGFQLMGIPRARVPAAPTLTVSRSSPTTVTVRVAAPVDLVERVDVHRTAVARLAGDIGTMGPPVATLTPTGDGFADYVDPVAPSWQPYWYRAVAWGRTDPPNGWRSAAGPASAATSVLVPPPLPPVVTDGVVVAASGSTPAYLSFRTDAPPIRTALGRFRLRVAATMTDGTGAPSQAVLATTLDTVAFADAVPPAGTDVVGPAWLAADGSIGVVVNPPAGSTLLGVRVTVVDPMGRSQPNATEVLP